METVTYDFGDLIVAFRSPRSLAWASEPMLGFGASLANGLRMTTPQVVVSREQERQPTPARRLIANIWYGSA
jgi:hypothetical protein